MGGLWCMSWGWGNFGVILGGFEHCCGVRGGEPPPPTNEPQEAGGGGGSTDGFNYLMQEHTLPEAPPQPGCLGSPREGGPPSPWGGCGRRSAPPCLSMRDIPGEGALGRGPQKSSLRVGELLNRSPQLQGDRGGGLGACSLSPSLSPFLFNPPLPPPCPPPHLHPADSSHQLPEAGDEDALQLQQLKEVMGLGEVTMGTCGDKATPAMSPRHDTDLGGEGCRWLLDPSVCAPCPLPRQNLVQGGPR